jgi:TPR repeat protein
MDSENPEAFAPLRGPVTEAAQLGIASAMMVLAENLRRVDPGESFQWFEKAGEMGEAEGLTQAGLMLASGLGTPRNSEWAVERFRKAGRERASLRASLIG